MTMNEPPLFSGPLWNTWGMRTVFVACMALGRANDGGQHSGAQALFGERRRHSALLG